jgi:hypothetical protein
MNRSRRLAFSTVLLVLSAPCWGETREEIVRGDKEKVEREGFWMYNDIPGAFEEAKRTGKPIVVVLRCLPCEECVKLDDELVDTHPVVRPLLEQFVCVRQVATNGLDLDLFQYDTDQSFAVFFLNADRTIYGRFGTRSHRTEWMGDVSLKGLAEALRGALTLHANYESVRESLAGKQGRPLEFASPEQYPALKDKYTDQLDYAGDVVRSCIHCHQIGDARREFYWHAGKAIPDKILWPYPHPKVAGLIMDPNTRSTIKQVTPESVAAEAGLEAGDEIQSVDGQPILSIADIQWVLHQVSPAGGEVPVSVRRRGRSVSTRLQFDDGWREAGDLSWRVSTWGLRRIGGGGMVLESMDSAARSEAGLDEDAMALRVKRVGRYGPHATARRAGVREGDILVSYDGRSDFHSEQEQRAGDRVELVLRRGPRRRTVTLPIQR